jgi:YVTN family beta-propeller protein
MAQGFTRGTPIDTDPNLALDSDLVVPSQKAIKDYVDTGLNTKQDTLTDTKSVKIVTSNVELDGDLATPGVNKVYGTDSSGTKGWKNDPVSPMGLIPGSVAGTFMRRRDSSGMEVIPSADRFYVNANTDGIIEVFEASSGFYLGSITLANNYGVIYCASRNEVWITVSTSGTIRRYDPVTFVYLGGDITGSGNGGMECIEISPTKLYIANWSSNTITEINPSTLTVVATITAATLGVTTIRYITYVNNVASAHFGYLAGTCVGTNEFYAINTSTNAVAIAGNSFGGIISSPPSGIVYNPVNDRYYISYAQNGLIRMFVPNTSTTLIANVPSFYAVTQCPVLRINPNTGKVYSMSFSSNNSNIAQLSIVCIGTNGIEWNCVTPSWNIAGGFISGRIIIDLTNGHVYSSGFIQITGFITLSKVKI